MWPKVEEKNVKIHVMDGWISFGQGRTDPMGIRAMPWGPPQKGAHQTFKNNANQQKLEAKKAQPSLDNSRNIAMK